MISKRLLFSIIGIQLFIALFYSGSNFLQHIDTAIALSPSDQNYYMKAGDHFEQFYRYSLFKSNIERGYFPYYSGYQYNITADSPDFTEGLVFFPFSFLNGVLSFIVGDILSYNLILLLSYVLAGLSIYFLVFYITRSVLASIIASIFFSTVPFRTSFLYGEMVYGVDACLLPLPIIFTELALATRQKRHFFLLGLSFFLLTTANFQAFYWFVLLTFPYFLLRLTNFLRLESISIRNKILLISYVIPGAVAACIYLIFVYFLMKGGVLKTGQEFNEVLVYAPDVINLFQKYSGNEKNLYLGWTLPVVLLAMPIIWYFYRKNHNIITPTEKTFLYMFFPLFIISYIFCFGPNIDKFLDVSIYKWMFYHIPGFNGTRTPGRIMAVVIVHYAILLGIMLSIIERILCKFKFQRLRFIMFGLAVVIIIDFNWLHPGMNYFDNDNKVYQTIEKKQNKILGLPFTLHGADFRNTPFQYYALKYNLRMFNGHSSLVPQEYSKIASLLFSINGGEISEQQWLWLKENKFEYIVAHHSSDPNFRVPLDAIVKLKVSNFLDYEIQDKNVYLFKVRAEKNNNNADELDTFVNQLKQTFSSTELAQTFYYSGWYGREVYTGDVPFRWMHGTHAKVVYPLDVKMLVFPFLIEFMTYCPLDDVDVAVSGATVIKQQKLAIPNSRWKSTKMLVSGLHKNYISIEFLTPSLYTVQTDTREFGCQVSDIHMTPSLSKQSIKWDTSELSTQDFLDEVCFNVKNTITISKECGYVLASVWHQAESWGIWSKQQAEMNFDLPRECQNESACDLRLSFSVFNAAADKPKVVQARINDSNDSVESITIADGQVHDWRIPLDSAVLKSSPQNIKLQLEIPDAQSPQSMGQSNDARVLGMGLHSYQFSLVPSLADCVPFQRSVQTADLTAECRENMLSSGWYAQEPWGIWSGAKARLRVDLPAACEGASACDLRLDLKVFHATADKPKQVRALFGDKEIAQLQVADNQSHTWLIPLDKSLLQGRTRGLPLTLEVAAQSPAALGESSDTRVLGVGLEKLGIVSVLKASNAAFASTCFGLDKTVDMATTVCDLAAILPQGWYERNAEGVWSAARAEVALQLPSACFEAPGCGLGLAFEVFNGSLDAPKTLTAYLQGKQVGQWSVPFVAAGDDLVGAGQTQLLITLPIDKLQADKAVNALELVLDKAQSPSELGETDSRVLGFKLLNYTLMPNFWGSADIGKKDND